MLFRFFMVLAMLGWSKLDVLEPGLGVGINPKSHFGGSSLAVELLNPPYWHNWGQPNSEQFMADRRFMPLMKRCCFLPESEIVRLSTAYPGRIWLLLNEPENPYEDNWLPQDAVEVVNRWAGAIGDNGIVACCGTIVYAGFTWLEEYMRLGGIVPDVWHIHIYEAHSIAEWDGFMAEWWDWCQSRDVCRPVIVTETGPVSDKLFAEPLLRYLSTYDDSRVWGVMWFSSVDDAWYTASLIENGSLTDLGRVYVDLNRAR